MTKPKSKRKTIIVNPEFQVRLAFWGSIITIAEVMVGCILVMLVATTNVNLSAVEQVNFFYKLIGMIAAIVVVMTGINFIITLLFSHRIAGPVYRIRQSMEQVGNGDLSLLIQLRSNDELHELKDTFNDMVSNLRDKVKLIEGQINETKSKDNGIKSARKKVEKKVTKKSSEKKQAEFVWPFKVD